MRVVILTSFLEGFPSLCLPFLLEQTEIDLAMIVFSEGQVTKRWKSTKRKLHKIRKIGLLGALNGIRMRSWYCEDTFSYLNTTNLEEIACKSGIRFERTPSVNSKHTQVLFKEANADLGISLGNGIIAKRVFDIPRYGMINVHHEILPAFRGAASVIWQIHEGSMETGYSIHQIDAHIDTGKILYQERIPIEFKASLHETTSYNYARLLEESARFLPTLISRYPQFESQAKEQPFGRTFTTPTFRQYLHMVRQHEFLRQKSSEPKKLQ